MSTKGRMDKEYALHLYNGIFGMSLKVNFVICNDINELGGIIIYKINYSYEWYSLYVESNDIGIIETKGRKLIIESEEKEEKWAREGVGKMWSIKK